MTYIFGTVGSAIVLALFGPALLGIDLEAECKRYEEEHGGRKRPAAPARPGTDSNCAPSVFARRDRGRQDGPGSGGPDSRASASSSSAFAGRTDHRRDRRHRDPGG